MSFSGIFLWDIKNGKPTSYAHAFSMEEQVSEEAEDEINPAFMQVAQAVETLAKQAKPFYDDEWLDIYTNFS